MSTWIETITPTDLDQAMDMLYARHKIWGARPQDWVFRGQGDSAWALFPAAFRKEALLYNANTLSMERGPRKHIRAQIEAEWRTLVFFLAQADQAGLPFPVPDLAFFNPDELRKKYVEIFGGMPWGQLDSWPPSQLLPNIGLAQHCGVHTRLIDFSLHLSVASYFAALSGAKQFKRNPKSLGEFTIWALSVESLSYLADANRGSPDPLSGPSRPVVELVRVPRAGNPNLHAQAGLFVRYWPYGAAVDEKALFEPQPLDAVLESAFDKIASSDAKLHAPVMKRLNIPIRWAPAMLRMLAESGTSAATFFPGYLGAAEAVAEREFWDGNGAAFRRVT